MATEIITKFEIQSRNLNGHNTDRNWSAEACGRDGNEFATEAEALEAIDALRALGEEWADAEYRVVAL